MKAHYIVRNMYVGGKRMKETDSYQYALEYIRSNIDKAVIENATTGRYQNVFIERHHLTVNKSAWYTPVQPYEN